MIRKGGCLFVGAIAPQKEHLGNKSQMIGTKGRESAVIACAQGLVRIIHDRWRENRGGVLLAPGKAPATPFEPRNRSIGRCTGLLAALCVLQSGTAVGLWAYQGHKMGAGMSIDLFVEEMGFA